MKVEINANEMATVELTDYGVDLYRRYYFSLPIYEGQRISRCKITTETNTLNIELWKLMNIFGGYMSVGGLVPFVKNVIKLETKF
jgi:hypothetical protein